MISHYLNEKYFVAIHLILFGYAFYTFRQTVKKSLSEMSILKSTNDQLVVFFDQNIDVSIENKDSARIVQILKQMRLNALYNSEQDLSKHLDSYESQSESDLDWADTLSSLFLLSGIVGTLIGIFQSVSNFNVQGAEIIDIIKEAFQAFGVTVFAVIFSALVTVAKMRLKSIGAKNINLLNMIVIHAIDVQAKNVTKKESKSIEIIEMAVSKLTTVISTFNASLINPEHLLKTLNEIQETAKQSLKTFQDLEKLATTQTKGLDELNNSIQRLPRNLTESMDRVPAAVSQIAESVKSSMRELYENFKLHERQSDELMREVERKISSDFVSLLQLLQGRVVESARGAEEIQQDIKKITNSFTKYNKSLEQSEKAIQGANSHLEQELSKFTETLIATIQHLSDLNEQAALVPPQFSDIKSSISGSMALLQLESTKLHSSIQDAKQLQEAQLELAQRSIFYHLMKLIDRSKR